ncbi:hypothetical protein ACFOUO_11305 [Salinithrix halophila]|uniref:Uncharacterized protein n=1 Tax=Salinithrix halophila TaxID=1485204 RepID=A0ABV8JF41_9BACL
MGYKLTGTLATLRRRVGDESLGTQHKIHRFHMDTGGFCIGVLNFECSIYLGENQPGRIKGGVVIPSACHDVDKGEEVVLMEKIIMLLTLILQVVTVCLLIA